MRAICSVLALALMLGTGTAMAQGSADQAGRKATASHSRSHGSTMAQSRSTQDRDEHAMTEDLNRQQLQNRN